MYANQEIIIFNECTNSGDRIYTYHNEVVGAMEAFGYSAFLAAKLVDEVLCMWNSEMNLPCAILRKEQVEALTLLGAVDAQQSDAGRLLVGLAQPETYDKESYDLWVQALKARQTKLAHPLPVKGATDDNLDGRKPFFGTHAKNEMAASTLVLILLIIVTLIVWICSGNF